MRRFYLERLGDETGVSGTGRVLEGVLLPSGRVLVEWRAPFRSLAIHDDFASFDHVHVSAHPGKNRVVWLDREGWHCFDCGGGGMQGNYCEQCGAPSTGYHPTIEGWEETERYQIERALDGQNRKMAAALSTEERQGRRVMIERLRAIESEEAVVA